MEYAVLGRTGLKVSVAGLGCGGPSRLGLRRNKSQKEAIALVRQALDLGVNFLDTAEVYGTEEIVGKGISAIPRDQVVISAKKAFPLADPGDPVREVRKGIDNAWVNDGYRSRFCSSQIAEVRIHCGKSWQ